MAAASGKGNALWAFYEPHPSSWVWVLMGPRTTQSSEFRVYFSQQSQEKQANRLG